MFDGTMRKKVGDRVIDSYSIFKKGIKPEWEAPQNSPGGEWQSRSKMTPQALDLFWVSRLFAGVWRLFRLPVGYGWMGG